jgi:hypothetical protein
VDRLDRTVFLFRADGRLLVRTDGGAVHEATDDEQDEAARALWPFHAGMRPGWGRPEP